MNTKVLTCGRLILWLSIFLISSAVLRGQDDSIPPMGIPDDWTFHHLVFSHLGTADEALAKGEYDKWVQINNDPRYQIQQLKHGMAARRAELEPELQQLQEDSRTPFAPWRGGKKTLKKDWSMVLGGTANATATITQNNASGSSSVSINGTSLGASAPTAETATITFGSTKPVAGSTVTIGSITYTFSTSSITSAPASGCSVYSATGSTGATNLEDAITLSGAGSTSFKCASGVTANSAVSSSRSSSTISLTAATVGSTGFTFGDTGTTHFSTFSDTPGTDGTQNGSTWTYWSGNAAASAAQVAANIASTINSNTTLSTLVFALAGTNSSGQAVVTVYAQAAGTTGNYTTAVSGFSGLTWSGNMTGSATATTNAELFPITYFYSTTAGQCDSAAPDADYVAFPTGLAGSANQPTIIAYDNLYSGCSTGPVPKIYWQYNTGSGYTISTSPVVSADGTQIAFMQDNGTTTQLVILKWASNPALIGLTSTSSYASSTGGCTAPCMITVPIADGHRDTTSSPFYDYVNDVIWVGDGTPGANAGYLHEFNNIFNLANGNTQPAEVTTTFPVLISGSNPNASPVLDSVTGEVMIGPTGTSGTCSSKAACGENFHEVSTSTGTVTTDTNHFNNPSNTGQNDTPIIDAAAGYAYVFTPDDPGGHAAVWQYHIDNTTDFQNSDTEVTIGEGSTTANQFSGTFDNRYFVGAPTYTTGYLYVCGRATGSLNSTIWQIPITLSSNTMGTPAAGPALTTATSTCSSLNEYYNGTTDYIFLSVQGSSPTSGAASCGSGGGGCIYAFNVTSGATFTASTPPASATAETGGTGGLVIDNAFSTPAGTGNVYFFTLSNQSCTAGSNAPVGKATGICGIQLAD